MQLNLAQFWPRTIGQRVLLSGIILFLTAGMVAAFSFQKFYHTPLQHKQIVVIQKGWGIRDIARHLHSQEMISSAIWFMLLARMMKEDGGLKAGEYAFEIGDRPLTMIDKMQQGEVLQHRLTIPEGFNTRHDMVSLLQEHGWTEAETLLQDNQLPAQLGIPGMTLEGWLFPDTYHYLHEDSLLSLLQRMVAKMKQVLQQEWQGKDVRVALTMDEGLILASLIEKETGLAQERERISGVFHNRLRRGMKLQTDPTVIYGLTDFTGNLTRRHLTLATPYNTYVHKGLPPGPICNPGRDSIHAAFHPVETQELYFVAKGDGGHVFSTTLEEHNRHVRKYQKQ